MYIWEHIVLYCIIPKTQARLLFFFSTRPYFILPNKLSSPLMMVPSPPISSLFSWSLACKAFWRSGTSGWWSVSTETDLQSLLGGEMPHWQFEHMSDCARWNSTWAGPSFWASFCFCKAPSQSGKTWQPCRQDISSILHCPLQSNCPWSLQDTRREMISWSMIISSYEEEELLAQGSQHQDKSSNRDRRASN